MTYPHILKNLLKNRQTKKILKSIYEETRLSKVGVTLSKLSRMTRIERHRLVGMVEVLVALGIVVTTQIGMAKVVAINPRIMEIVRKLLRVSR